MGKDFVFITERKIAPDVQHRNKNPKNSPN